MKKEIIFATHNSKKVEEVNKILAGNWKILTLNDINFQEEIPELGNTLEENAFQKAEVIYKTFSQNCFADDSGLIVPYLNGEPGVFSGRYAGEPRSDHRNIDLLLKNLGNTKERNSYFMTCICLIFEGKTHFFSGRIEGEITKSPKGNNGFGYDPIFIPKGHDKTFAEMSSAEKNSISHRAIAVNKLVDFLNTLA